MPLQKWSDAIWVAQLAEEPGLSEDLDQLLDAVRGADPVPDIVVDFAQVQHCNSSNLSQILRLRKHLAEADARLRLSGPRDSVWAVFLATGLDKVFTFAPDVSTALADLQLNTND